MVDQRFLRRLTYWPEDTLLSGSVLEVRRWLSFASLSEYITHVALVFFRWRHPERHPLVGLRGGWGAWVMNLYYTAMYSSTSIRSSSENNRFKRLRPEESESDYQIVNDPETISDAWPRYIVVSAKQSEQTFDKLSPFVVSKALKGIIGERYEAKILRSGKVLVKCTERHQSINLLGSSKFGHVPIEVSPHNTLNFCKGVIRSRDLRNATEQEVLEDLKDQHVVEVNRVTVTRNGEKTPTNTFILKFDVPTLPLSVKVAITNCRVEPYVPNPLRCFNCQRFGHHKDKCGKEMVCGRCGQEGHDLSSCNNPLHCPNCKGEHFAYSKECAKWKQEKEIQAVKVRQNLSFQDARKIVESRTPGGLSAPSYAAVTRVPDFVQTQPQECKSCKILIDKLCTVFPEKAEQMKKILQDLQTDAPKASKPTVSQSKPPSSASHSAATPTPSSSSSSGATNHTSPKKTKSVNEKPSKHTMQANKNKSSPKSPKQLSNSVKSPKKNKSNTQSKNDNDKDRRPKINRLVADSNSSELSLNKVPAVENRFAALEHMEDEDEDDDGDKGPWKDPPSWNEETSSWENSNAGY